MEGPGGGQLLRPLLSSALGEGGDVSAVHFTAQWGLAMETQVRRVWCEQKHVCECVRGVRTMHICVPILTWPR